MMGRRTSRGRQRDDYYRLFTEGERTISDYCNAERDYNDIVRQYYDSLIRHRRSMIRLNTAVGQRILTDRGSLRSGSVVGLSPARRPGITAG
jgi:hypothetical protein